MFPSREEGWRHVDGWSDNPAFQNELLHSLYHNSPLAIAVIDRLGRFMDINRDPEKMFGYTTAELSGRSFSELLDSQSYEITMKVFERTLTGEKCTQEIRVMTKDGHPVDLSIDTAPLTRRSKTVGILVFFQDISERKRSLEKVRFMAYNDDMTGLPNRRFFTARLEEKLTEAYKKNDRLAVCYLDVDQFKLVNASYGRDFGDMLLMMIAERLSGFFGEAGNLARMEGDEFAGLLTSLRDADDLSGRMDELMRLFESPFELAGVPLHISISIGISMMNETIDDAVALLKKADTALHRVKENGRNDYLVFSSEIAHTALHKLTLQHEIKKALQNGEFLLYYQPQYDLATGRIVGLEALVRWKHPERGLVPPGEFIPAAEESGLIVPLGEWVLQEACRQNKSWQDAGMTPIPVAVNLSFRQFMQRNLIRNIAGILKKTELDPSYLELEITESITMDVERASSFLRELADLGVGISIDDFGTGYSSFHYLRNFPIGSLKIDRSFVRDIQQDPSDAAIVSAIIAMAHNLQLQVIAEGVETEEQVKFLRTHRCDEMQGYFGSPPLPKESVEELLWNQSVLPIKH